MNKLKEKYSAYPNEQLLDILVNREDYKKEAIKAVEELVIERNIDNEEIKDVLERAEIKNQEKIKIENEPLGIGMKVFLVVFPIIGIVGLGIGQLYYHERGYEQKKADIAKYMFIGLLVWMVIVYIVNT